MLFFFVVPSAHPAPLFSPFWGAVIYFVESCLLQRNGHVWMDATCTDTDARPAPILPVHHIISKFINLHSHTAASLDLYEQRMHHGPNRPSNTLYTKSKNKVCWLFLVFCSEPPCSPPEWEAIWAQFSHRCTHFASKPVPF